MSVLINSLKPRQILCIHKVLGAVQCNGVRKCHWYPDYKPGPYPETEEERKQAAKKYNLLPEEYKPYPNTEKGCGDYPHLPYRPVSSKDPWYPWDNYELRKNYNEPVHLNAIKMLPEAVTTIPGEETKAHIRSAMVFLQYVGSALLIVYILSKMVNVYPRSEKQYPNTGVVHYTFELSHDQKKRKRIRDPACDED